MGLWARRRLVDECHRFARAAGYRKMRLWTTDQRKEARQRYRGKGHALVAEAPAHVFGKETVKTWEVDFRTAATAAQPRSPVQI
jgi:hypothetical protein